MRAREPLSDIGHAIQSYVEPRGFAVVRDFVGHGIGRALHEPPRCPTTGAGERDAAAARDGARGRADDQRWRPRRSRCWRTTGRPSPADGALSAHFEHTIAVTEQGPEVLTRRLALM